MFEQNSRVLDTPHEGKVVCKREVLDGFGTGRRNRVVKGRMIFRDLLAFNDDASRFSKPCTSGQCHFQIMALSVNNNSLDDDIVSATKQKIQNVTLATTLAVPAIERFAVPRLLDTAAEIKTSASP